MPQGPRGWAGGRRHALIATGSTPKATARYSALTSTGEDGAGWLAFWRSLTARGLSEVKLVTSDAHAGLVAAIGATPGAAWQRCRTHYTTNLMAITPKASWPWVRTLLHSVFDQPDAESVAAQYDRIIDALSDKLPKVAEHLENARADLPAFTAFPQADLAPDLVQQSPGTFEPGNPSPHRRRRHLPRPQLLIRLVGAVLAEQHDEWAESRRYLGLEVLNRHVPLPAPQRNRRPPRRH